MSAPKKANKPQASAARNSGTVPEIKVTERKGLIEVNIKLNGDKNGGHNHVIVEDIDDKHVSVGLTTKSKKGKNHPNLPLEQSPLGDGKESFVRRQGTVAPKKEYKAPRKGKMTQNDYTKVKKIGEKAKKKYLEEKATKK